MKHVPAMLLATGESSVWLQVNKVSVTRQQVPLSMQQALPAGC